MWIFQPRTNTRYVFFIVSPPSLPEDKTWMVVQHNNSELTKVPPSPGRNHYTAHFEYSSEEKQLEAIIGQSEHCEQELAYHCRKSRLFSSPGEACWSSVTPERLRSGHVWDDFQCKSMNCAVWMRSCVSDSAPLSWWVGGLGEGQVQTHWGGALRGSKQCACGLQQNCVDPKHHCNCDAERIEWYRLFTRINKSTTMWNMLLRNWSTSLKPTSW